MSKFFFQNLSCPTKNSPMPKKICSNQILVSNKNLSCQKKFSNVQPKFVYVWPKKFMPNTKKNPYHHKFFFHNHVHKNVHTHETRLTHSNKVSAFIKNEFVQQSLHIKFSWLQCPQNSSQNTFNSNTNYIHCQISWVINIVQVTPCQIARQFKNAPRPRLQHDQPYNMQNFNKSK